MPKRIFTEEIIDFVKSNYKGLYNYELTDLVNQKFCTHYTDEQIKNLKKRNVLSSGVFGEHGYFLKGHTINKGRKLTPTEYENAKKGFFKKGHKPKKQVPIGTEIVDKDGYVQVKIDDIQYARHCDNWIFKHKLIYEQHKGPVPEGYAVIFADGDKRNFDLDNLVLVTRAELLYLNRHHMIYNDSDLTKNAVAIARLATTANKKKRKKKEKK